MAYMFIKITAPNMAIADMNEKVNSAPSIGMGVANMINAIQGGCVNAQIDVSVRDVDASIPAATGIGVVLTLNDL